MNLLERIKNIPQSIRDYVQSEKELIRMRMVKTASRVAGNLLAGIFIIIFLNIFLAIIGMALGFWFGSMLESNAGGFALSGLVFLVILILLVIFRKQLLVNPMINQAVASMIEKEKIAEEDLDEHEES